MLNIYTKCCSELLAFEIWDGYYAMRFNEFKSFYKFFPEKHFSDTLDIGCGIGYQSAFLSCISNTVVASDVDMGAMIKHSRGLDITREFIKATGIRNISVVNADAESLPFADNSFDLVYSSYAFQYVPDKARALAEIKRVLRPGGHFFCVLPLTGGRIKAAKQYYKTAAKKIPSYLVSAKIKKEKQTIQLQQIGLTEPQKTKLLPPPDDESNSFISELFIYSPGAWKKIFRNNGYNIIGEKYVELGKIDRNTPGLFEKVKKKFSAEGLVLITRK